jgi:hypothetical protein
MKITNDGYWLVETMVGGGMGANGWNGVGGWPEAVSLMCIAGSGCVMYHIQDISCEETLEVFS